MASKVYESKNWLRTVTRITARGYGYSLQHIRSLRQSTHCQRGQSCEQWPAYLRGRLVFAATWLAKRVTGGDIGLPMM